METTIIERDTALTIVGIGARTSLATAAKDIPALWQRFFTEALPVLAPKNDQAIYAVYCDYQSNWQGEYTMILGVERRAPVPEMRSVSLPSGSYARFHAKGDPAQVVWSTWSDINERWARRADR